MALVEGGYPQFQRASQNFAAAAVAMPTRVEPTLYAAMMWAYVAAYDEAIERVQKTIAQHPSHILALQLLALLKARGACGGAIHRCNLSRFGRFSCAGSARACKAYHQIFCAYSLYRILRVPIPPG